MHLSTDNTDEEIFHVVIKQRNIREPNVNHAFKGKDR